MTSSFLWGILAASSLLIGGLLTFWIRISNKVLGLIMAFGSGVLISAVAFELAHESVELSAGSGMAALGLFTGAIVFFTGDWFIGHMGGHNRKSIGASHGSELGLLGGHTVSFAMLIAVFISNLPEALAATTGLASGGWSRFRIMLLWLSVTLVSGVAALAGFALFENASNATQAFINMFAGGAILVMLANTMIPEAFEHGGKLAGLSTVMGFALAIYFSMIS
jgi:ZIP family zinc transporter